MIGIAMEKWPDDALRRVVDAPVERWTLGTPWAEATCLYGHAAKPGQMWAAAARALNPELHGNWRAPWGSDFEDYPGGVVRYDALCNRFGLPRTVRAIKLRALRILLDRHPLEQRLVVLQAEAVRP